MNGRAIRLRFEAALVTALYWLVRALPIDLASAIGGWLGRNIGYRLAITRRARRNLARAMPEMHEAARERVLRGMWDNLGRTTFEFPRLDRFRFGPGERVEIDGAEHVATAVAQGRGILFFAPHLGNWELAAAGAAVLGVRLHLVYRAPNNPHLDWMFRSRVNRGGEYLAKGTEGARRAVELLRKGESIGMLVDQKMNDGIAVPFFGRAAMTAPALARFAAKFRVPVIPAHIERIAGARFRLVVEPPMEIPAGGDRTDETLAIMTEVNRRVEGWIRAHPEQWLWLHRRWPDS